MYPDERVARFVSERFVPVKIHIKERPSVFERFGARWTPTLLVLDASGAERYRFEGYLPPEDFLAQLKLGLGHAALAAGKLEEAGNRFREVVDAHPNADAAPEALYWAGVSRYKATHDGAALAETARAMAKRYPDTTWAKKASVWSS